MIIHASSVVDYVITNLSIMTVFLVCVFHNITEFSDHGPIDFSLTCTKPTFSNEEVLSGFFLIQFMV